MCLKNVYIVLGKSGVGEAYTGENVCLFNVLEINRL